MVPGPGAVIPHFPCIGSPTGVAVYVPLGRRHVAVGCFHPWCEDGNGRTERSCQLNRLPFVIPPSVVLLA